MDEETEAANDAEFWTPDRQLMAALINAVYLNTQATGNWEKGKVPDFPTMGPKAWQPREEKDPEPMQGEDLLSFHLSRLGMPAGGGRTRL